MDWLNGAKVDLDSRLELIRELWPNNEKHPEYNNLISDSIEKGKALKDRIELFCSPDANEETFNKIQEDILNIVGESDNTDEIKNSIGNLTLLNAEINRSYGNALFVTKRRIIIENDQEGKFIPICTKNVFLKYFDEKGTSRTKWTEEDIKGHTNAIGLMLDYFLTDPQRT